MSILEIHPRLVVRDVDGAIEFYRAVFGAELLERFADPDLEGLVVHAALRIGSTTVAMAGENPDWNNHGPQLLNGSPVILQVMVADADAVGNAFVREGGEVVFPIADQFYGKREGRLKDPFGHLWIISQELEKLSDAVIQARMADFHKK